MKKILITGANSYIGESFEKWLEQYGDRYVVDTVDMIGDEWRSKSFERDDVVFHVAAIVHKKEKSNMKELYRKINCDLTVEVVKKAKRENVRQFIFLSTMAVYGEEGKIGEKKVITKDTIPKPTSYYGKSKLQAEKRILHLQDERFNVVILRPPMIYGKGSKGNYTKLAKLARWCPVFPDIENERSMLYVDNLCEFVRLMIDNEEKGLFFPQNREYVSTRDLVGEIGRVIGRRIVFIRVFNGLIKVLGKQIGMVNKVFGNLVYDKGLSDYNKAEYRIRDFRESVELTELERGQ